MKWTGVFTSNDYFHFHLDRFGILFDCEMIIERKSINIYCQ